MCAQAFCLGLGAFSVFSDVNVVFSDVTSHFSDVNAKISDVTRYISNITFMQGVRTPFLQKKMSTRLIFSHTINLKS